MVSAAGQRPYYDLGEIEFKHAHEILTPPSPPTPSPPSPSPSWPPTPYSRLAAKETTAPKLIDVFNTRIIYTPFTLILLSTHPRCLAILVSVLSPDADDRPTGRDRSECPRRLAYYYEAVGTETAMRDRFRTSPADSRLTAAGVYAFARAVSERFPQRRGPVDV